MLKCPMLKAGIAGCSLGLRLPLERFGSGKRSRLVSSDIAIVGDEANVGPNYRLASPLSILRVDGRVQALARICDAELRRSL
jgi:hypothetical protein